MTKYICGFYRSVATFDDSVIINTLESLNNIGWALFPLVLRTSKSDSVLIRKPADYKPQLLPKAYSIDKQSARLPLETNNGMEIVFTQSSAPQTMPASLLIEVNHETFTSLGFTATQFLVLFKAVLRSFAPDYGYVYDQRHKSRDSYRKRKFLFEHQKVPTGLFWINYYGDTWVHNIGRERLDLLAKSVYFFEWLENGGALFAIQENPYSEDNPRDVQRQLQLEQILGLEDIQARFPNRGY